MGHFLFAEPPVHCFDGTPGNDELFCYFGPHLCFKP
jgi:hypothetical protein